MPILIERADGGVSVLRIRNGDAPESAIAKWTTVADPAWLPVVSFREVNDDEIPRDRSFRDAWNAELSVDMAKAREIQKARLRTERAPLLQALDVEFIRALEQHFKGAPGMSGIIARKQALRDVTADQAIASASTPDELKQVRPKALGK